MSTRRKRSKNVPKSERQPKPLTPDQLKESYLRGDDSCKTCGDFITEGANGYCWRCWGEDW